MSVEFRVRGEKVVLRASDSVEGADPWHILTILPNKGIKLSTGIEDDLIPTDDNGRILIN